MPWYSIWSNWQLAVVFSVLIGLSAPIWLMFGSAVGECFRSHCLLQCFITCRLCRGIWRVWQSLLSYHCSVLESTTYSCCLHSWYKYRVSLPHPAVPKHLPPWCFSSFLPTYCVLIENSGSANIWAQPWYAFCKSPPFLPPLSKKLLTPHTLCPFFHCVLSATENRKHYLICPEVMVWHLIDCATPSAMTLWGMKSRTQLQGSSSGVPEDFCMWLLKSVIGIYLHNDVL